MKHAFLTQLLDLPALRIPGISSEVRWLRWSVEYLKFTLKSAAICSTFSTRPCLQVWERKEKLTQAAEHFCGKTLIKIQRPYSLNFDVNWPLHSRTTNSSCKLDFTSPNWLTHIYNNLLYWLQTTNVWINDWWGCSVRKCCTFHFLLFLNLALDRSQLYVSVALPRRKSSRCPLNRKLGGQRWSLFRIYILDMSVLIVILNRRQREGEKCYVYVYHL